MDITALFQLSYGLYLVTASNEGKENGCIINTACQVTNTPNQVAVTVNKDNFTCQLIEKSGHFALNVLTEDTHMEFIARMGFKSGRDIEKFAGMEVSPSVYGDPLLRTSREVSAVLSFKVTGKLDVGTAVGAEGTLTIMKDLNMKEPYIGSVQMLGGEIAEDIASYYANSEQTPTVCGLGVLVNPDLSVNVAGGYLIQVLPFAPDSVIDQLEKNLQTLPPVTQMMREGMTPDQIALRLLDGLEPNLLDESEVLYQCDCSRERTERILYSLGNEDLQEMADDNEPITVNCQFCDKKYVFTPQELLDLRK